MEQIKELFTTGNIVAICGFIAKPLILLIICKLVIGAFMKIAGVIMEKSKLEKGVYGFVKTAFKIILWAIAIIIIADSCGVNTASLVTVLGVITLALSLAFQNIMTNIFSGITILISKPFKTGDYVEIAGVGGTVKEIELMRTTLKTPDGKIEMIPNGDVCASRITNYSVEPLRRVEIKVSASYDASTEAVQKAIFEVIEKDARIKKDDANKATVRLSAYNANDIEYTVRMWVDSAEYWNVYFDMLEAVRESFAKNGIEFSYPHVVVHNGK